MSKTYFIDTSISAKVVLSNGMVEGILKNIKAGVLPKHFQNYLDTLEEEMAMQAFIKYCNREWIEDVLEQQSNMPGVAFNYAPVKTEVRPKQPK